MKPALTQNDTTLCSRFKATAPIAFLPTRATTDIDCAMALRGVGEMTLPGATDALAFKTYVSQVLVPNLWSGACVVMDNLPRPQK